MILLLTAIVLLVVYRQRRRKSNNNGKHIKYNGEPHHVTLNLNDLRAMTNTPTASAPPPPAPATNGKVSNGNLYNSIATSDLDSDRELGNGKLLNGDTYREPFDGIQGRKLPDLPRGKMPESGTGEC